MTENSGQGTAGRLSCGYRSGSAGLPYRTTELRIVDDQDRPLPTGTPGEIVTRGTPTMKGYFKDPEATAIAMRGGWLHTGDIGYLDEEGFLFVVDRKKDMIIKGGENIFPAEVENALYTHPGVAEAAVVGAPDDVYGEEIVAFVVKQPGAEVTAEGLIAHVKSQIVSFKAPAAVHFLGQLPKSGVGKILRRELRSVAADARRPAAAQPPQTV
jgi:long-chain acyl-CoA synthetase